MQKRSFKIFIITLISAVVLSALPVGINAYADDSDENQTQDSEMKWAGEYGYTSVEHYDDQWPGGIAMDIRYENYAKYPAWPHYIVNVNGDRQRVYQAPSKDAKGIDRLYYGERCKVLELIENEDGEPWYIFVTKIDGEDFVAFIPVGSVEKREFQLTGMSQQVEFIMGFGALGPVVYIDNYRNLNGPPVELPSGEYYDPYKYRRGQSAPGYNDKYMQGEFRYIPDGMLCIVEELVDMTDIEENNIIFNAMGEYVPAAGGAERADSHSPESIQDALEIYNETGEAFIAKVYVPSFGKSFWIDSAYIDMDKKMQGGFGQAIIVDRKNQNIGVFEYNNGWKLISLSYSTTGKSSETAVPTPLGHFIAIEKKDLFEYEEEGGTNNEGFAPYAIRFSGGGYLHGVPMKYEFDSEGKRKPVYTYAESILSIGTVPESHMCIRNFTSHAQFMHEWAVIGSCAVIVFE